MLSDPADAHLSNAVVRVSVLSSKAIHQLTASGDMVWHCVFYESGLAGRAMNNATFHETAHQPNLQTFGGYCRNLKRSAWVSKFFGAAGRKWQLHAAFGT